MNLDEWVEKILDDFCKEKEIQENTSVEKIKTRFHGDFHEIFFYKILALLHKFIL